MYKNILIATDGSELAGRAVTHGLQLAKALNSQVRFVAVTEIWSALDVAYKFQAGEKDPAGSYERAAAAWANKILIAAQDTAKQAGVSSEIEHIKDRPAAEGIVEAAEHNSCDLIVMASHGRRGFQALMLGSVALEVLTKSKSPVMIIK